MRGLPRMKRAETVRVVRDCMTVSSSEEGVWEYTSDGRDLTCGLYLVTHPDMLIQIDIIDLDVDCETGLLVVKILKFCFILKNNIFPFSVV